MKRVSTYNTSKEIVEGMHRNDARAYQPIYDVLRNLLSHFSSRQDKKILASKDIDSPQLLLCHLFSIEKLKLDQLETVNNVKGWISTIAANYLVQILRKKSEKNFIMSMDSLDKPLNTDTQTTVGDMLSETLKEENAVTAEVKISAVEKYLEDNQIIIDDLFLIQYCGLLEGKTKQLIMPEFKQAWMNKKNATDTNEAGWNNRYDLTLYKCKRFFNDQVPYSQITTHE